jgi:cytochrome c oxidase subunit 2
VPAVLANPNDEERAAGTTVGVVAHQFYWQYEYPNGALSFDELLLPVDRKVTLELESRDVVHSWWVPELTGKRDAIPGRVNRLSFDPDQTGTFTGGKCGEYCGIQHALMRTVVRVVSTDEYEAWLAANTPAAADPVALGQAEWEAACAKCHGLEGEGGVGPPIAGNATLTNAQGLTDLLENGQNLDSFDYYMPPVGRGWSERQIEALIAYVESSPVLSGGAAGGG